MYLYRKLVVDIQELDKKRELRSGLGIYLLSEELSLLLFCEFGDCLSCEEAIGDN